jgi:hypothetical protein
MAFVPRVAVFTKRDDVRGVQLELGVQVIGQDMVRLVRVLRGPQVPAGGAAGVLGQVRIAERRPAAGAIAGQQQERGEAGNQESDGEDKETFH